MAGNFMSAARVSSNPLTNSHTSAGNYTGTNALTGSKAGLVSGRSKVVKIWAFATGSTVANEIRVYLRDNNGGGTAVFQYKFSIFVQQRTLGDPGVTAPWTMPDMVVDISLPGTDFALAFNKEKDATNLTVGYDVRDHDS